MRHHMHVLSNAQHTRNLGWYLPKQNKLVLMPSKHRLFYVKIFNRIGLFSGKRSVLCDGVVVGGGGDVCRV